MFPGSWRKQPSLAEDTTSQKRLLLWTTRIHDYWEKSPRLSDQQEGSQAALSLDGTAGCTRLQAALKRCLERHLSCPAHQCAGQAPQLFSDSLNTNQQREKKPQTPWSPHIPRPMSHGHKQSPAGHYGIFVQPLSAQEERSYDTRGSIGDKRNLPKIRLVCGERKLAALFQTRPPFQVPFCIRLHLLH